MFGLTFCLYKREACHYVVQLADAEIVYIKLGFSFALNNLHPEVKIIVLV